MAIPNNYIDKITKDGESRPICPPAEHVRVENDNFEGESLDDVLDEISESIGEAGKGSVNAVKVGSTPYTPDGDGVVDLSTPFGGKVDKVTGKGLSTNDYTDADKAAVGTIGSKANSSDVYDKQTVDGLVAEAGKVQTVSVNGGTPVQPVNGNVNLPNIPTMADVQDAIEEAVDDVVVGQVQGAVIDNFNSDSSTAALSAACGKDLNDRLEEVEKYWNGTIALALVTVLQNMAFASDSAGQTAANTIINAIQNANNVVSIAATYIGGTKYAGDTLSASDFSVTATYGSGVTKPVTTGFTFSPTTLASGTNTITISYSGQTTTVTVTAAVNTITAITGVTLKQGVVAPTGVDSGSLDVADYIDSYSVSYANGDTGTVIDMNTIQFASGVTLSEGNNTLTVQLAQDTTITYTVTIEASSAIIRTYHNGDGSTGKAASVSFTFDTPLDITPNKVTISSEARTGESVFKNTDCIASATIHFPSGVVDMTDKITTLDGSNRTLTVSEITLTKNGSDKVTAIKIGEFKYNVNGTNYNLYFRSGLDYTFKIEEEQQS